MYKSISNINLASVGFLSKSESITFKNWHMFVTSVTSGYHPKWTIQSNLLCVVFSQTDDIKSSIFTFQLSFDCVPWFENLADSSSSWFNWSVFVFFFSFAAAPDYTLVKDLGWSPESASPLVVSFFDLFLLLVFFFFNIQRVHFQIKRCLPVCVCVRVRETKAIDQGCSCHRVAGLMCFPSW